MTQDDAAQPRPDRTPPGLSVLDAVAAEIEAHLAAQGWDGAPALFALVPTATVAAEPAGATLLGLTPDAPIPADSLTPIAQDDLPDKPLDELLAGIEWPDTVAGCAVSQEIVILPPSAEDELSAPDALREALEHPARREARLVVAVTRAGRTATVLRVRAASADAADDIAFGTDVAPNLTAALLATLE